MNIHEILIWSGSILAIVLYYPLIAGILRNQIEQSCATWMLWVSLDVIAVISIVLQHGNYLLLVVYSLCGSVVIAALIYKKLFKWTRFETFVLALVIICLVVWYLSGPRWATIAVTFAGAISAFPQIRDSWKKPDMMTGHIYLGYAMANGLSCLGGKAWTVEDRLYQSMATILCLIIMGIAYRKQEHPSVELAN